jgi:transcriptional regulator with XRE-family HTH domain
MAQDVGKQPPISLAEMVELLFEYGEAQEMNVTYQAIARATGIAWNNIRKIRVGDNKNPGLQTIQALTDYFGVKLDYFNCRTAEDCRAYLARKTEKDMRDSGLRMRQKGISTEGLDTLQNLQAMIEYVKFAEGLTPTDEDEPDSE